MIRFFQELYWKIPYDYRPHELWYSFKCWAWYRYTTVKSRHLDDKWHDKVSVLPHCMFEILSQFIEKEASPGIVEWYGEYGRKITVDGQEKYVRDEMQDLYSWWHEYYNKKYQEECDALWDEVEKYQPNELWEDDGEYTIYKPKYDSEEQKIMYHDILDEIQELETKTEEILLKNMRRVCNLMPYLWT